MALKVIKHNKGLTLGISHAFGLKGPAFFLYNITFYYIICFLWTFIVDFRCRIIVVNYILIAIHLREGSSFHVAISNCFLVWIQNVETCKTNIE